MARDNSQIAIPEYPIGSRYETVARGVLGIEGGLAALGADHGGITNLGISLRFLITEGKIDANHDGFADYDLDMDGDIDGADIRLLTPSHALNLFWRCFWRRLDLDRLPVPIDGAVFDQAVNGGTFAAVKMLQLALNQFHLGMDLTVDGQLGRITAARVGQIARQQGGMAQLVKLYRDQAEARYRAIVRADPSQSVFLDGWISRARRLGNV